MADQRPPAVTFRPHHPHGVVSCGIERVARPRLERLWDRYPRSYEPSAIVAGWLTTLAVAGAAALVGLGVAAAVR